MPAFIWTLWGAIQHKISKLDFDFWEYATGRWERALGMLDSNEFPDGWKMFRGMIKEEMRLNVMYCSTCPQIQ